MAFAVPTIEHLHNVKALLDARGVEHSEVKPTASGVGGMITVRDPDNIQLDLFAAG